MLFYVKNNLPLLIIYSLSVSISILLDENSFFIENKLIVAKEIIFDWKFYVTFFSLLLFSSILMIYLLTKMKSKSARIIYGLVMGLSTLFLLLDIALIAIHSFVSNFLAAIIIWIDIVLLLLIIYGVIIFIQGKTKIFPRNLLVIMSSISLGRTVSLFFDIETLVISLVFFALYDAFSVFLGPLRKVLGKPQKISAKSVSISMSNDYLEHYTLKICERGIPVFITKTRIVIGIGDLLFFSIIITKILIIKGIIFANIVFLALIIGNSITLWLVKRISPFPGLPIPIFIVLITLKIIHIY